MDILQFILDGEPLPKESINKLSKKARKVYLAEKEKNERELYLVDLILNPPDTNLQKYD